MDQKMNGLIDQRLEKLTDFVESCDSDWLKDGVEYEVPIERRRQNRHETRARVHLCATGVCIHAYSPAHASSRSKLRCFAYRNPPATEVACVGLHKLQGLRGDVPHALGIP